MSAAFIFNNVARTSFGAGCAMQIAEICRARQITKPLLVTDQGIVACGLLAPVQATLESSAISVSVYSDVSADPPEQNIFDAVAMGVAGGCDAVIGFGGGSSMDVAKLIAVLLKSKQTLAEMYGVDMVTGGRLPLIQVPTTSGTGSEATAVAIVTTGESTKAGVVCNTKILYY